MKKLVSCILIVVCVCMLFAGCEKPAQKILGTWNGEANFLGVVTNYSFTFNEDGTGKMTTALDIGVSMTYTLTDENVSITTSLLGIENTTVYTYEFNENTLTLNDGERTIVLTKAD